MRNTIFQHLKEKSA